MQQTPCRSPKWFALCLDGAAVVLAGRWRFPSVERVEEVASWYPPIPGAVVCAVDARGRALGGGR